MEDTGSVKERGTCEECGRPNRRLYRLRRSRMADEPDEDLHLCVRCRVIRRFLILWIWVFHLGPGLREAQPHD